MNNATRSHLLPTFTPCLDPARAASGYVLRAFGGFTFAVQNRPVREFGSNKARALLVYLVLEADRAHGRETLAELFWPERPARAAFNNLNQALFTLRRALGDTAAAEPLLRSDRSTVQLSPNAPLESDVAAFRRLIALQTPPSASPDELPAHLVAAADWYQGALLHGLTLRDAPGFEDWLAVQRERLHLDAVTVLQRLFSSAEARGAAEQILHYGRRLVELEPWHEPAHRAVMRALSAGGQRRAALRQYEQCRSALAGDLGIEPEPATVALAEQIRSAAPLARRVGEPIGRTRYAGVPKQGGAQPAPGGKTEAERSFIGRDAELAVCAAFFADPEARLLTIIGPGGVGKSRLAVHAARRSAAAFPSGVHLIDMAQAGAPAEPVAPIAAALGVAPRALFAAMSDRRRLLVLDHLAPTPDVVDLLNRLIADAPGVKLLVTARQRFAVRGERVLALNGLATPGERDGTVAGAYPAVQLFTARAAQFGGVVTEAELNVVAQICRLLDGLPRSIELAAALTASHSCRAIIELVAPAAR